MHGPSYGSYSSPTRNTPKRDSSFQSKPGANISQGLSTRDTSMPQDFEMMGSNRPKDNMSAQMLGDSKPKRPDGSVFTSQTRPEEVQISGASEIINELPPPVLENRNANLNVTRKVSYLMDKVSEFSYEKEFSKEISVDNLQWKLETQKDIPDSFKQQISAYKVSGEPSLRLERKVSGQHGVLAYILKNRLLIWFFLEDMTIEYNFNEPIQEIGKFSSSRIHFTSTSTWNNRYSLLCVGRISSNQTLLSYHLPYQQKDAHL